MTEKEFQSLKQALNGISSDIKAIKSEDPEFMKKISRTVEDFHAGYLAGYADGKSSGRLAT